MLSAINPSGLIIIKSADPNNDAAFGSLRKPRGGNSVFEDFDVSSTTAAGGITGDAEIQINGSTNITFSGLDVRKSTNRSALDDGHGLAISAC